MKFYDYKGKKFTRKQLDEKYQSYFQTQKNIVNKAESEKRELTAEEIADFENLDKKLNDLEAFLNELNTPVNTPVYSQTRSHSEPRPIGGPAKDKTFRGMFYAGRQDSLDRGGWNSFEEFLSVLSSGRHDPRLLNLTMTEGVPSEGGFAVPEEFGAWLMDTALESEIVRPRATVWPMKSETRNVPAWDSANHNNGTLYGGLEMVFLAEGGTGTPQKGKLRLMKLTANKGAIFSQASNELVADGLTFEAQLGAAIAKAIGFGMDYYFINGTGAGQPLGILKSPALITVSKESGQVADTIIYENVIKMFARMHPACLQNAVWICNQTTLPQLMSLIVSHGVTGTFVPAVQQADGKFYLLGKEIILTEKTPVVGDLGDIIFADLSQYAIGLRKDISLDKSNLPGWYTDAQDYRAIVRFDGQGTWDQAVTPVNGDSLSPFVTLEAR